MEIVPQRTNITSNATVIQDILRVIIVGYMFVTHTPRHVNMMDAVSQLLMPRDTTVLVLVIFLGKTVRLVRVELLLMNNMISLLHHPVAPSTTAPPNTTTPSAESVHIEAGPTPIYQQPTVWAISIFIVILVICVLAYVSYHNRNKVWPFFTFL